MTEYKLVNPYVEGKFKKLYSGETAFDAAKKMWKNLSSNFTNCVPEFAFSLERVQDNKMFHFKVKESVKDGDVNFIISEFDNNVSAAKKKKFNNKLVDFQKKVQSGGYKKNYDDEDDEYFDLYLLTDHHLFESPITYFWYYPSLYPMDYEFYFVPTWVPTLSPYVLYAW